MANIILSIILILVVQCNVNARIFSGHQTDENDGVTIIDRRHIKNENIRQRRTSMIPEPTTTTTTTTTTSNISVDPISSQFTFPNDSNNVAFVFWKHAETTVVFILTCQDANTTNYNKLSNKGCKSHGRLYKSENHGGHFDLLNLQDKTEQDDMIHSIFLSPLNSKFMILTDYQNKKIFITEDEGTTFKKYYLKFSITFIYFHPTLPKYIAAFDSRPTGDNSLYVSENAGKTWNLVSKRVLNYFWAQEKYDQDKTTIYYEVLTGSEIEEDKIGSILKKSSTPYKTSETMLQQTLIPFSLYVGNEFIIVQQYKELELFISYKRGDFMKVIFDTTHKTHLHHVVFNSENNELLLGIIHPDLSATLYLSDAQGNNFVLLQEDIATEPMKEAGVVPKIDFYQVKGLYATYIINHKTKGTLITFDKGHTWNPLKYDHENTCTFGSCQLILYLKIDSAFSDYTSPILSKDSAPGFIIAQGYVGSISELNRKFQLRHEVYISIDGGRKWIRRLKSTSGFALLDHGGVIASTQLKFTVDHPIDFSIDYGQTWLSSKFTKLYSRIAAIITESTAKSLIVNVFGFLQDQADSSPIKGNTWIVWKFNFSTVLQRKCDTNDFKIYAHDGNKCVLGERILTARRKADSKCFIGAENKAMKIERYPCVCEYSDYICNKNLYDRLNSTSTGGYKCVPINPNHKSDMSSCKTTSYFYESKGYVKLNGDKCKDGVASKVDPVLQRCPIVGPKGIIIIPTPPAQVVAQAVIFTFTQVAGVHGTTYTWNFNDGWSPVQGNFTHMRSIQRSFYRHGLYNVTLTAENVAGKTITSYLLPVVDDIHMNAFINFDEPVILRRDHVFRLERLRNDGVSIPVIGEKTSQYIWSFGDNYLSEIRKPFAAYAFNRTGIYKVEVTVFSSISHRIISRTVTVYDDAVVFDVSFSSTLDLYNKKTIPWIEDFKHKFKMFLAIKYNLVEQRVIVRGKPTLPTKVTVIITDTEKTVNSIENSAENIANRIINDINIFRPFLHGFAASDIHVIKATNKRVLVGQKLKNPSDTTSKSGKAWVYVVIVLLMLILLGLLIAFYQYRRKRGLHFFWRRKDGMENQLFSDMDDDVNNQMNDTNNFMTNPDANNHVTIYKPNQ